MAVKDPPELFSNTSNISNGAVLALTRCRSQEISVCGRQKVGLLICNFTTNVPNLNSLQT